MIDKSVLDQYEMTIGIECHVQLKTATKLFSAVSNDARDAEPNMLVSPIDYGMPGVLPYTNEHAIELAIRAGIALNAEIAEFSKFDRKHYFYPDLPKGYQITQFDQPTVGKGVVSVPFEGNFVEVGITRAHIEEDAGKSTHPGGKTYSLVDLNRAGTPLIEVVSEPDITSPSMAKAFVRELYLLMKYADVTHGDLFHGNMRFDVNLSVKKKGSNKLGTRTETKNLNSFRSVEKAAEYEFNRQVEVLENGGEVVQETRGWDDNKMRTFSQRTKEDAHDYRYFPEPDIPPISIERSHIDRVKQKMDPLPNEIRKRLGEIGLSSESIEIILDRDADDEINYIESLLYIFDEYGEEPALYYSNWLINVEIKIKQELERNNGPGNLGSLPSPEKFKVVYDLFMENKISSSSARILLYNLRIGIGEDDIETFAKNNNLIQESDSGAIAEIVKSVLEANPDAANDVKNGEMKAIGFLVGQIMKESKGQANPQMAQAEIKKQLGV